MDFAKRNIGKTNRNDATDRKSHGGGGGVTVIQQGGGGISLAEAKKEFLSKKADDNAEGVINYRRGLKILGKIINSLLVSTSDGQLTDEAIMSAKKVKQEIDFLDLKLEDKYLRKDIPDSTIHLLSLLGGAVFGKDGFVGGLAGHGARIDEKGNGELESLVLRRFLQVPELHFNRVEVLVGDKWRAPGGGIFKTVNVTGPMTGEGTLRLEKGEYGTIAVGDICMGIFHAEGSKAEEDKNSPTTEDDFHGSFKFAGFYTCYFTITEVTGADNSSFKYELRAKDKYWTLAYHPSEAMTFVCYGSFSDTARQSSVYETRTYRRFLAGQKSFDIRPENIMMQDGDLSNLSSLGYLGTSGYSSFLRNVYFSGEINQFDDKGVPILQAHDRGEWPRGGTVAAYYDRFSYKGGLWLCTATDGTSNPPAEGSGEWICQVKPGASMSSFSRWHSERCPYPVSAMLNMAGRVVISNVETSAPPFPLLTDKNGKYITQADGSYLIASYVLNPEWTLIMDESNLKDGADGASLEVRYSSDKVNWHTVFAEKDKWMQQRVGDGPWSQAIQIVGEAGSNGKDAPYSTFEFAVNSSLTEAPKEGWQDAPPAVAEGQYLWMRTCVVNPATGTTTPWTTARIGGEKGDKGDGYTHLGEWRSGMRVPKMGVVQMAGSAWVAKTATVNPPLFCLTDKAGNYLRQKDGGYLLNGTRNSAEYDLFVARGLDGIPGEKGADGKVYYTWLRYADDAEGNGMSNEPAGKKFLGLAYNKETQQESNNPKDYTWSSIKGEDGVKGDNGYTWIKYSDYPNGFNPSGKAAMYQQPTDKTKYIGIANNKQTIEEKDNNDPKVYTWALFRGADGVDGKPGKDGKDGRSIVSVTNFYLASNKSTGVTTDMSEGWTTSLQSVSPDKKYLWNFEEVVYTSGDPTKTTPAIKVQYVKDGKDGINGQDGKPGKDGINGQDGKPGKDGINGQDGAPGKDGINGQDGAPGTDGKGIRAIWEYYGLSDSAYYLPDYWDINTIPTVTKEQRFLWNKETIEFSDDTEINIDPHVIGVYGDGYNFVGQWYEGMLVHRNDIVVMGGNSFVCIVDATREPPIFTLTDQWGNRLTTNVRGYILTGQMNTDHYSLFAGKGDKGDKGEDGKDGAPGTPGADGTNGLNGCVMRKGKWAPNIQWRNDEHVTDPNVVKYVDFCLVPDTNPNSSTGWKAYKCLRTHVSRTDLDYTNTEFWDGRGMNVELLTADFVIAKNAKIDFLSGNEIRLIDEYQKVRGGISGSQQGEKVRFWAGAEKPEEAPYQVDQGGVTTASKFRTGKSGVRVEMMNGVMSVFGKFAKNIEFGVNDEGMSVMRYFDNDGQMLYDLGPKGITEVKRDNDKWVENRFVYIASNMDSVFTGWNWENVKNPFYSLGNDCFQFLSGYIGGVMSHPDDNRRYFTKRMIAPANYLPNGYYVQCKGNHFDEISYKERMTWERMNPDDTPDDINPKNPYVNYSKTVYEEIVMKVENGFIVELFSVYFNL